MSFNITKSFTLVPERHMFPNLLLFQFVDCIEDRTNQAFYFRVLPQTTLQTSYFTKITHQKTSFKQQIHRLDTQQNSQMECVDMTEYKDKHLLYVRQVKQTLATTYRQGDNDKAQTITDIIQKDINNPITFKQLTQITTENHYVHLLSDDVFVVFDSTKLLQLGQIKKSVFKMQIKYSSCNYNENYGSVIHIQGCDDYLVLVQKHKVIVYSLYMFEGGQLNLKTQLTGKAFYQMSAKQLQYTFSLSPYPILVVNERNRFQVVNFSRFETLDFELPQLAIQTTGDNQFQTYMLQQLQQYYVFVSNGLGIISQFDWARNKQRLILFSCSINLKTQIYYSAVQDLLSYEPQEIDDLLYIGGLFLMASGQDIKVKSACKYTMQQTGQFINSQLRNQCSYNSIKNFKNSSQLADLLPCDFHAMVRGEKTANNEQFVLAEDNLDDQKLQRVLKRFQERLRQCEQTTNEELPSIFAYQADKPFDETVVQILKQFRDLNPVRRRFRRTMSLMGVDDSDDDIYQNNNTNNFKSKKQNQKKQSFQNIDPDKTEYIQQLIKLIPCPTMFSREYEIFSQQRFVQVQQNNSEIGKLQIFDFYRQQVVQIDFGSELVTKQQFNNILLEYNQQINTKREPSERVNNLALEARCAFRSLHNDIVMNAYWRSGLMNSSFDLISGFTAQWMRYLDMALEARMLDSRLCGVLIVSKTIVDVYFSIANLQVSGSKMILTQIGTILEQLINQPFLITMQRQLSDFQQIQRQEQSQSHQPHSVRDLFKHVNSEVINKINSQQSNNEASTQQEAHSTTLYKESFQNAQNDREPFALPQSDGETLLFSQMPFIFELAIFNDQNSQTIMQQVHKFGSVVALPTYYAKQEIQLKADKAIQSRTNWYQRFREQYNKCRYLYQQMYKRSLYSRKMIEVGHSPMLKSAGNFIAEFKNVSFTANQNVNPQLINEYTTMIQQNQPLQFVINSDFIAQKLLENAKETKIINAEDVISLVEVIECAGAYAQTNTRQIINQYVNEQVEDSDLYYQLYSFGTISYDMIQEKIRKC